MADFLHDVKTYDCKEQGNILCMNPFQPIYSSDFEITD